MKIKKLNLIFLVFSVFFVSCGNNYKKETKIFNSYLKSTYNFEIGEEIYTYFISPSIKCVGCESYFYEFISTYNKNATLITSDPITQKTPKNIIVLVDSTKKIDRLNFGIINNYVIITKNRKIIYVENFTPDKIEEISKNIHNKYNNQ